MNRLLQFTLRNFVLLFVPMVSLLSGGCIKDETSSLDGTEKQVLQLSLATVAADPDATADESAVKSVYVYIFNERGMLENPEAVQIVGMPLTDDAGVLNARWEVTTGPKTIYVIANPPASLALPTDYSVRQVHVDNFVLESENFLVDLSQIATRGMMMTGMAETTVPRGGVSHKATVQLARRHARIDLRLRLSEELENGYAQVKVVKATLDRQNWYIPLFLNPLSEGLPLDFSEERTLDVPVASTTGYTSVCSFYTGMRPVMKFGQPGSEIISPPVCLNLEVTLDGDVVPMKAYLNTGALDGGTANVDADPIVIQSNCIYRVDGTLTRHGVEFGMNIMPWEDAEVVGDIYGSWIALSSDRVVMDWWNLEQRFDTGVDYTSDGTVSFLGYVVDGRLTTDGSNLPTWLPAANITGLPDGTAGSGRIGLTYALTSDAHPDVKLRLKTGNIIKDMTVTYDNGFLSGAILSLPDTFGNRWTNYPANGVQLAKIGNVPPDGTADADWDNEIMPWALVDTRVPGCTNKWDYGYGPSNTVAILETLGAGASVADIADRLGSEWYWPSCNEITFITHMGKYFGPSYKFSAGDDYWSSTEYVYYGSVGAHLDRGNGLYADKKSLNGVRFIRNM